MTEQGAAGEAGHADPRLPSVWFEDMTGGRIMVVTDATHPDGMRTPIRDGAPGDPGRPGVSPRVVISPLERGFRITVYDEVHPAGQSVDILNGTDGAAASVSVGAVATLKPGEKASVVNSGTGSQAVLNFGIPAGRPGQDLTLSTLEPRSPELSVGQDGVTVASVGPYACYEWAPSGECVLNVEGWSPTGEQWSTLYVTPAVGTNITGGTNLTLKGSFEPGKRNYCQLKGFKGQVRLYVLEVED